MTVLVQMSKNLNLQFVIFYEELEYIMENHVYYLYFQLKQTTLNFQEQKKQQNQQSNFQYFYIIFLNIFI
jgi:hypothetical protein